MKNTQEFKSLLEAEKIRLIEELSTVGKPNPGVPGDWQAVPTDLDSDSADENEVADEIEEFGENSSIVEKLEAQLRDVEDALAKIESGTYGICEVCGEEIPVERLRVNPSARTLVEHSK
jgi:RNA polymerase-binding transcription factor DksA